MFKLLTRRLLPVLAVCAVLALALSGCGTSGLASFENGEIAYSDNEITATLNTDGGCSWTCETSGENLVLESEGTNGKGQQEFKMSVSGSGTSSASFTCSDSSKATCDIIIVANGGRITRFEIV